MRSEVSLCFFCSSYASSLSWGTSNQITSTMGALARTYGYNSAGNTTSYTGASLTYNQRGRLAAETVGPRISLCTTHSVNSHAMCSRPST